MADRATSGTGAPRFARPSQGLVAGCVLLALAALGLWFGRDLTQGTLRSLGPAMLPRAVAVAIGLCGVLLVAASLRGSGERLEAFRVRGPLLVGLGIAAFALTIRPVTLGALQMPGLGLIVAGPLAIVIGGYATPDARLRDNLILAFCLTPFCMVLFGDILGLPIPVFPQSLAGLFPEGFSQRTILRVAALAMALLAAALWLLTRDRGRAPEGRQDEMSGDIAVPTV